MKTGRNDPCPCDSGKKYKKCCLEKDEELARKQAAEKASATPTPPREPPARPVWQDQNAGPFESNEELVEESSEDEEEIVQHEDLPALAEADQQLVDAWWDEVTPFYDEHDADEMLRRVESFHETHLHLFEYLYLDEEFLFELGAELARRKQWDRYTRLLQRLRKEQPAMYAKSAGYFDYAIICDLAATGRREEIASYFSSFHERPEAFLDPFRWTMDLLAWMGFEAELRQLVEPIAKPLAVSPNVIGGHYAADWIVFFQYLPALLSRDNSSVAASSVQKAIHALGFPGSSEVTTGLVQHALDRALTKLPADTLTRPRRGADQFYRDVGWNFCGYLHDAKSLSWVSCRFLVGQLHRFWGSREHKDSAKDPFHLRQEELDRFIARANRPMFHVEGVPSVALLQAVAHFADYLAAHGAMNESSVTTIRTDCVKLFERCRGAVDTADPTFRLCPSLTETR